ncbi:MAG: YitT family protein [Ferruginibacter sp.]
MIYATNYEMQFEKAYAYLLPQLQKDLPSYLTYHNADHTIQVIETTSRLAIAEGVNDVDKMLLMTAALYHDAGFLHGQANHEETSCTLAKETLTQFGYTQQQVNAICRMIMATKLPQAPTDKLECILCDADLHYLGTDQFSDNIENLFREFKHQGLVKDRRGWDDLQNRFLKTHRFFTPAANQLYAARKEENVKGLHSQTSQGTVYNEYALIHDILLMVSGVIIAGFALQGFLVPNKFLDGGVTGLSLLLHELYHINLAFLVVLLNLPLIIAGYFSVSKQFALKTFVSLIMLGLCVLLIPYPVITSDKLLISIFGGMFLGLGIGLTMRAGGALDGIEVLALYTVKKTSFTITEIILAFNIIIFSVAALKFGLETALYSVLTYLAASKMIDYVVEGIQAYTGVTIISAESETIKHSLVNKLGRGITVYKGERGFLPGKFEISTECDIIFTVVTRLELRKLKNLVYDADPKAFVYATTIKEASGGIIKRRHTH